MVPRTVVPRGRHAPPLHVRQQRQRARLFASAGETFARVGYADATAEMIAREAGMSKATFYEHFHNKEGCICALADWSLGHVVAALRAGEAAGGGTAADPRHSIVQLIGVVERYPRVSQTLLVEITGAGPRAAERRDRFLSQIADYVVARNARLAALGLRPRIATEHDAYGLVGAIAECLGRHLRMGVPADIHELEPVFVRLVDAVVAAGDPR